MILVTGGAGFIGANFVLDWLGQSDEPVINLDKLTYAGNMMPMAQPISGQIRHALAPPPSACKETQTAIANDLKDMVIPLG